MTPGGDALQGMSGMPKGMKKLCATGVALAVAVGLAACGGSDEETTASGGAAAAESSGPITFVTWGGALEKAQQTAMVDPFVAETSVKVNPTTPVDYAKLKAMVETGNVTWDVVDVEPHITLAGCKEGWLEKLDFTVINRDKFLAEMPATDCSVPTGSFPFAIAYRTDKFADAHPQDWAEFFDTQKFPGKRSFVGFSPLGTLEPALLADGVAPEDLYPLDVDRALKKLDTIKDEIVWWESGDQAQQLMNSGEVVLCACWSTRMYDTFQKQKTPVAIEWNQQLVGSDDFVIPKGSKNAAAAMKFLEFITDADKQVALTELTPWGPSTKDGAVQAADATTKDWIPTTTENLKTAIPIDYGYWAENLDKVSEQFKQWQLQ